MKEVNLCIRCTDLEAQKIKKFLEINQIVNAVWLSGEDAKSMSGNEWFDSLFNVRASLLNDVVNMLKNKMIIAGIDRLSIVEEK